MMTRSQGFQRLALVLLVYGLLSFAHTIWLPLGQAPDEVDHFLYTRFIAQHGRLPLNYEERETAGKKAYLPALYHSISGALVGWSDSDAPPILKLIRQSPRFDLIRALFHTESLINTEDELAPYRGVVLMWHLGRMVSIIWGLGVIVTTFLTTLEIFPGNYRLAVISAAIIAFVPTFIFISSSISYEPLVAFITGLYFWVLIKIVKGDTRLSEYVWLGLLMGLSVTVKYVTVILPIQVVLVVAYLAWRHGWGWWGWLKRVAITGAAAMLASSWWFLFLVINFNEIAEQGLIVGLIKPVIAGGTDTTQNYTAFLLTGGQIGSGGVINPPSFSAWVRQIFQSFWAEQIGSYPLEPIALLFIGLVCLAAAIGLIRTWQGYPGKRTWIALLVLHTLFFLVFPFLRYLVQGELSHTAQGRHVLFPIATVLPILIIYGWQSWFSPKAQQKFALIIIGGLACWSLVQFIHVARCCTSPLPVHTTPDILTQIPRRLDQAFGNHLVLLGYDLQIRRETGALNINLYWQSPTYPDEDYLLEVNLVQNGATKLNWLAYPTNGRYPTRVWESWETIIDNITFPLGGLSPGDYQVQLQLHNAQGPLPVNGTDRLVLDKITIPDQLALSESDVALPVSIDGREVVRGLSLWQTGAYRKLNQLEYQPRMAIPFVWQGQPDPNEQVKWLLVDNDGQVYPARKASTYFEYFVVGPEWKPGDYRLRAEVWRDEGVIASQETAPLVAIFNKQPRLIEPPPIPHPLEANFANRVKLLGYDLPARSVVPGQGIPVTLYWQGLRTMEHNYTFFTKLLDSQQQQWAGIDRFARDGYKTTHWLENEVVIDRFELLTDPQTPDGIYWLDVGLYFGVNQTAVSLPLVVNGQPGDLTSVTFGPVKIGGPPPGIVVSSASPQHLIEVELGDVIRLRGYDIARQEKALALKLYWESLVALDSNQTVFVHVRNRAGETIAQMDRPPVNGVYPTSLWAPGEIIPDELVIPLPDNLPPDNYSVVVGMYDYATGLRLPIAESADNSATLLAMQIE